MNIIEYMKFNNLRLAVMYGYYDVECTLHAYKRWMKDWKLYTVSIAKIARHQHDLQNQTST